MEQKMEFRCYNCSGEGYVFNDCRNKKLERKLFNTFDSVIIVNTDLLRNEVSFKYISYGITYYVSTCIRIISLFETK